MGRREGEITEKRENSGTCLMSNRVGWTTKDDRKETTITGLIEKVVDGSEKERKNKRDEIEQYYSRILLHYFSLSSFLL